MHDAEPNLHYAFFETHAQANNITHILIAKNRHMINGLVDILKSINNTAYNNNFAIISSNYARKLMLTLAEIVHRINQLCIGLRKLKHDISTTSNYTDVNKIVRPTLIDPVDVGTLLNSI